MIVYAANKQQFLHDCFDDEIEEVIQMLLENGFSEINVFDLHSSMEVDNNTSVATFFCKKK